jgi:hypothetical protein
LFEFVAIAKSIIMDRQLNIWCSDDQVLTLHSDKANAGRGDEEGQFDVWRGECEAMQFTLSGGEYQLVGLAAAMMILLLLGINQFQSDMDVGRFVAGVFDRDLPVRAFQAVSATRG